MKGGAVAFAMVLAAAASWTFLLMRKPKKKKVTIPYIVFLGILACVFFGIAYLGPKVRGKVK